MFELGLTVITLVKIRYNLKFGREWLNIKKGVGCHPFSPTPPSRQLSNHPGPTVKVGPPLLSRSFERRGDYSKIFLSFR
jgi:hypothetical protein